MKKKIHLCVCVVLALALSPALKSAAQPEPVSPASPPTASVPGSDVSVSVSQIIKLENSGIPEELVLSYIDNSAAPFNISPENLVYLNSLHLPNHAITAMLEHDRRLRENTTQAVAAAPPQTTVESPVATAEAATEQPAETSSSTPQDVEESDDAATPQVIEYFNDSLTPNGAWLNVSGYGRCWQPTVARGDRSWRPYCDRGQWIFTDAGWYWNSSYPWGWATFHYGRWANDAQRGWLWVPGKRWAPAWVTWRNSDRAIGWAPLPPGTRFDAKGGITYQQKSVPANFGFGLVQNDYVFVPTRDFAASNLIPYRMHDGEESRAFANTRALNDIVREPSGILFNRGVDVHTVAAISAAPVMRAKLKDSPTVTEVGLVPGQGATPGTLRVFRPQVGQTQNALLNNPQPSSRQSLTIPPQNPATGPVFPSTSSQQSTPITPVGPGAATAQPQPLHPQSSVVVGPQQVRPPFAPAGTVVATNQVIVPTPPNSVGGGNAVGGGTSGGTGAGNTNPRQ